MRAVACSPRGGKGEKQLERSHTQNMKLFPGAARYKLDPLFFAAVLIRLSVPTLTPGVYVPWGAIGIELCRVLSQHTNRFARTPHMRADAK